MAPDDIEMTQDRFVDIFVGELSRLAGRSHFADGESIEDYARDVALTYWAEADQRADGPEACAEAEFDCWEPE